MSIYRSYRNYTQFIIKGRLKLIQKGGASTSHCSLPCTRMTSTRNPPSGFGPAFATSSVGAHLHHTQPQGGGQGLTQGQADHAVLAHLCFTMPCLRYIIFEHIVISYHHIIVYYTIVHITSSHANISYILMSCMMLSIHYAFSIYYIALLAT